MCVVGKIHKVQYYKELHYLKAKQTSVFPAFQKGLFPLIIYFTLHCQQPRSKYHSLLLTTSASSN